MPRKLVMIVIDGLGPDALAGAIAQGAAPTLAMLRARDPRFAASVFPSLTPVCLSSLATGAGPGDHRIPGLQWYHRGERRFVEYGSSFLATVSAGDTMQSIDDFFDLNHVHLSPKLETVFESVEDSGRVAASINFYVWRGRHRHEIRSRVVRRVARRAGLLDATWAPTRFFFGQLFASDRTGAPRNLGINGRNDDHAGAVGSWLVARDGFDFLLFYLPETDAASHRHGPDAIVEAVARADANVARLMGAAGGPEPFLERYDVILTADHGQSAVREDDDLRDAFDDVRLFAARGRSDPDACDLAVAASNRAAMVYRLSPRVSCEEIARRLVARTSVDLAAWREHDHVVVLGASGSLRFAPGGRRVDARAGRWQLDGDAAVLGYQAGGVLRSSAYPNALERLWSILRCVNAGDVVASATPGFEFRDAGGQSHLGGGSHGSLHAVDSVVPFGLVFAGAAPPLPDEPSITDAAGIVRGAFGLARAA